jgi:hypothetical protein
MASPQKTRCISYDTEEYDLIQEDLLPFRVVVSADVRQFVSPGGSDYVDVTAQHPFQGRNPAVRQGSIADPQGLTHTICQRVLCSITIVPQVGVVPDRARPEMHENFAGFGGRM